MQFLKRRASAVGMLLALLAAVTIVPASARPIPRRYVPASVTVTGTITEVNTTDGTLEVTDRNGLSATLKTDSTTRISLDGQTATLADLDVGDTVQVTFNRTTLLASRIVAQSPPPVQLTGTLTAKNADTGVITVTTDRGTSITLTTNTNTVVRLNGSSSALGSVGVGDRVRVLYRPADKIALRLEAVTPALNVFSGAITALDIAGGKLDLTSVVGVVKTIPVNAQTDYRLNGRRVATSRIAVGQLATVRVDSAGIATVVGAETPPIVDLRGTLTAVDTGAGTIEVTTAAMTAISLDLIASTVILENNAVATTADLAAGQQVEVRYEYRLLPDESVALRIIILGTPS